MPEVNNFIIPESNFNGLYKIGDDLQRNRQLDDAAKQHAAANKNALNKWVDDYADPKENLSGTPTDPEMVQGYANLLEKGRKFILENPGADQSSVTMVLSKDAAKLAKYAATAKVIKNKVADNMKAVPENSGYDKFKLQQKAIQSAWYNPDGTVKSLDQINPDQDYVAGVVQDAPEEVTNNSGIDNWMKGQRMVENSAKLKTINPKGGYESKSMTTNAYPFAVPDVDDRGNAVGGFVPQYEVAHDNEAPIIHEFKGQDGKSVSAPVRMVTPQIYKSILANSPGTADWLRGQIKTAIKTGDYKDASGKPIDINSPQAEMLGKAIMYDELKARGLGGMKEVIMQKENPIIIKNYAPNQKGSVSDIQINNIYKEIQDKVEEDVANISKGDGRSVATQLNQLSDQAVELLVDKANKLAPPSEGAPKLSYADLYLSKEPNGKIALYKRGADGSVGGKEEDRITYLSQIGANLGKQANTKAKSEVVRRGNETTKVKGKFD